MMIAKRLCACVVAVRLAVFICVCEMKVCKVFSYHNPLMFYFPIFLSHQDLLNFIIHFEVYKAVNEGKFISGIFHGNKGYSFNSIQRKRSRDYHKGKSFRDLL